jgi:hypothetical protein
MLTPERLREAADVYEEYYLECHLEASHSSTAAAMRRRAEELEAQQWADEKKKAAIRELIDDMGLGNVKYLTGQVNQESGVNMSVFFVKTSDTAAKAYDAGWRKTK